MRHVHSTDLNEILAQPQLLVSSFNGVFDTGTVVKMSALTLVIYLPLGLGPLGLLVAHVLCNATSTIYGIRRTSADSLRSSFDGLRFESRVRRIQNGLCAAGQDKAVSIFTLLGGEYFAGRSSHPECGHRRISMGAGTPFWNFLPQIPFETAESTHLTSAKNSSGI